MQDPIRRLYYNAESSYFVLSQHATARSEAPCSYLVQMSNLRNLAYTAFPIVIGYFPCTSAIRHSTSRVRTARQITLPTEGTQI